jgi:hypothetical protein
VSAIAAQDTRRAGAPAASTLRGVAKRKKRRSSARRSTSGRTASPRPADAASRPARAPARPGGPHELGAYGERPQAPWHPWPLSEILIFVGAIAVAVGMIRGPERNLATIGIGIVVVLIGTLEVSLREHLSGYRSHTMLLAIVPVVALHSVVVLGLAALTSVPRWVNAALLPLDVLLLVLLFRWLRGRFERARRERVAREPR